MRKIPDIVLSSFLRRVLIIKPEQHFLNQQANFAEFQLSPQNSFHFAVTFQSSATTECPCHDYECSIRMQQSRDCDARYGYCSKYEDPGRIDNNRVNESARFLQTFLFQVSP